MFCKGQSANAPAIIADRTLHIIDFKYGQGVLMEAENNPQMMFYALGTLAVYECLNDIDEASMTIYQPRRENISTWTSSWRISRRGQKTNSSPRQGWLLKAKANVAPVHGVCSAKLPSSAVLGQKRNWRRRDISLHRRRCSRMQKSRKSSASWTTCPAGLMKSRPMLRTLRSTTANSGMATR